MTRLIAILAVAFLAACSEVDGISSAQAQSATAAAAAPNPEVAEGAVDGQVFEYY